MALDDALVSPVGHLEFMKCNMRLKIGKKFEDLPLKHDILSFIRDIRHFGDIFYLSDDQSISRRKKMFWHTARDDTMFTAMRCISRHEDTQKPVQATKGTRLKTKAKVAKSDKKKQPIKMPKAKGLDMKELVLYQGFPMYSNTNLKVRKSLRVTVEKKIKMMKTILKIKVMVIMMMMLMMMTTKKSSTEHYEVEEEKIDNEETIMKKYDYGHLEEIKVRQEDQKLYKFRDGNKDGISAKEEMEQLRQTKGSSYDLGYQQAALCEEVDVEFREVHWWKRIQE
uniref:Uncharacterized protein n=1 Tax=Tanacetum cinerariifolium TaxID=118510 RepID=A0A699JEL0_TANCI|nr:hypothetical protein [Tanacetum cinerariifolium]